MKKEIKLALVLIFIMFSFQQSYGQQGLLRYAEKEYNLFHFQEAADTYVKAFEKRGKYQAAKGAAMSYEKMNDYGQAYEWWEKTVGFENASPEDYTYYIGAANQQGKLEEVMDALDTLDTALLPEGLMLDSLTAWYQEAADVRFSAMDSINSSSSDFIMANDRKGNKYFVSDRGASGNPSKAGLRFDVSEKFNESLYEWTGRDFLKIYKVQKDGEVSSLSSPVPESFHFSDPFFLAESPVVFYTVTRKLKRYNGKKVRAKDRVNPEMDYGQPREDIVDYYPELYFSKLDEEGNFVDYQPFPLNNPLEYSVITPYVDEANQQLYFASNMPGGYGGFDLYVMGYDEEFNFDEPKNLGPEINTALDERDPFLVEEHFYFASNGHAGLGGMDIFRSVYNGGGISGVENMGVPYNSSRDDFAMRFDGSGDTFLSSNRPGGKGLDDIYTIQEELIRFLARVIDCEGNLLTAGFVVDFAAKESNEPIDLSENEESELETTVSKDQEYQLEIRGKGYFTVRDSQISTGGMSEGVIEREYRLIPIPYSKTVFVDLVYYDLDRSMIRQDAQPVLDKLATLMGERDYLDLSVRSYTDSRASKEYNQQLSHSRAEAVAAYLSEKGISSSRVHEEWFGEEDLVNDCGDGQPCPEWKHQQNRRSELVLVAFSEEGREYELPEDLMELCDLPNLGVQMDVPIIYFDFDKATLRPKSVHDLNRIGLLLKERDEMAIALAGHTDIRGPEAYNEALSEKRAEVVRDYLVEQGITPDRVTYQWFGKQQPVHDCSDSPCSEAEHQLNRRTEIKIMVEGKNVNEDHISQTVKGNSDNKMKNELLIVAGVFSNEENAKIQLDKLESEGCATVNYFWDDEVGLYYCYIGRYTNMTIANAELDGFKRDGFKEFWIREL
ncbi:OmpA family protein [Echinicola strongylocentroti]|nr:OmpA family protein [Echinicola strongylocentroti]